jgi:hypothetical protein
MNTDNTNDPREMRRIRYEQALARIREAEGEPTADLPQYIVVPAPGHYGDRAKVVAAHASYREAARKVGKRKDLCVRAADAADAQAVAGGEWLRVYEQYNPIVVDAHHAARLEAEARDDARERAARQRTRARLIAGGE